jgi:hypothetical protein
MRRTETWALVLAVTALSLGALPALPGGETCDVSSGFAVKLLCKGLDSEAVQMRFLGSNPKPEVIQDMEQLGRFDQIIGDVGAADSLATTANVTRTVYSQIYPGVDLISYRTGKRVQYDLVVGPWANPDCIRILYEGMESLELQGNLPAYQLLSGSRQSVDVSIRQTSTSSCYCLDISRYNKALQLVIRTTATPLTVVDRKLASLK